MFIPWSSKNGEYFLRLLTPPSLKIKSYKLCLLKCPKVTTMQRKYQRPKVPDKMLPRYDIFRHYTTFANKDAILISRLLYVSFGGAIGPGAYVTKTVWLDPADPQNVVQIQIRLGMPSDKIQTYIDLRVNINKVIVVIGAPFGFPDQWTLNMPVFGAPIPLDGDTAMALP